MKSELIHLLAKLKADHPDFQNLIIASNGVAMACLQHGYRRFETLTDLESYAWPQVGTDAPRGPSGNVGSSVTLPPSAQDARAATALPSITLDPPATAGFHQTKTAL
jgi:hypothetical protein